jgi:hypothetical protein
MLPRGIDEERGHLIAIEASTNELRYGRVRIRLLFESTGDDVGHSNLLCSLCVLCCCNARANGGFSLSDKELRAAIAATSNPCR